MDRKRRLALGSILLGLLVLWLLLAAWAVPALIDRAYRGESLSVFNNIMKGRGEIPLEVYLQDWRSMSRMLSVAFATLAAMSYALLEFSSSRAGRRAGGLLESFLSRVSGRADAWPVGGVLLLVVWIGLLTGIGEVSAIALKTAIITPRDVTFFPAGLEALPLAPLVYAVILSLLALLLLLPRLRWRDLLLDRPVIFLVLVLAFFSLTRALAPGVHPAAAALLASGVAVRISGTLTSRGPACRRLVRRTMPWLGALLVATALGLYGGRWIAERWELARLRPPRGDAPNVLLIILDTVRARNVGWQGYGRPTTPAMDGLAGEGVTFSNAIATAPWTLPSHASMFTGRWAHELSSDWTVPLDGEHATLAEWFKGRGYATAGFVANLGYLGRDFGLARGFIHYEDQPVSLLSAWMSAWLGQQVTRWWVREVRSSRQELLRVTGAEIRGGFLSWLDSTETRPFFAFLNYYDAHAPYLPPAPFASRFSRPDPQYWIPAGGPKYTAAQLQDLVDTYDNSIAYLDYEIGLLFEGLRQRGGLRNTIVVITSDHGEEFGERGVLQHGNSLYLPSLHVPLIIRWPEGVPAGRAVEEPVTIRDIAATLVDLLDGNDERPFPGRSLARFWRTSDSPAGPSDALFSQVSARNWLPAGYPAQVGDMQSVVAGGLHYIVNGDGSEELYDLFQDPWESTNLVESRTRARALPRLRELAGTTRTDSRIAKPGRE